MCLLIFCWVMTYNPDCEFFCENVDFADMHDDWKEVCNVLGAARIVTADKCSAFVYHHSQSRVEDSKSQPSPMHCNRCLADTPPPAVQSRGNPMSSSASCGRNCWRVSQDSSLTKTARAAAGNCTYDFLYLAHVASEMNLDFPRPFKIHMDNSAAECFAKGTAFKSKLKHIDCRQEWVKVLRDRNICTPIHVDSKDNLADMFTKILSEKDFVRLRSKLMYELKE